MIAMGISTVIYVQVAAGILSVLPIQETVASPLNLHSVVNKRSVDCLFGEFYNTAVGHCQACITCGKGEFFNDDCYGTIGPGTCSPCDKGYYQSKDSHADDSCYTCKHCQHRVRISKCTRTENTICGDCLPGFYEMTVFSRKRCMKCPTQGNLPKPCRQKPTTTTVPPVPPITTTLPPSTTPTLPITTPDNILSPILNTTLSETPTLTTSTTPLATTTSSFDGLTTTPAVATNTEIATSHPSDLSHAEIDVPVPLYSFGLWAAIIVVTFLMVVLFGGLFWSGCKRSSSSGSYVVSPEGDTRGHENHFSEFCGAPGNAENYPGENIELEERIPMLAGAESETSIGTTSFSTTPGTSLTSTPRGSVYSNVDSLVSYTPRFDGCEIILTKDNPQEGETKQQDLQKELLANISVKLNEQVSKNLFEDFKIYCQLREKLDIRTLEESTSFSECVCSLIQQNDFAPEAVATFLCSFFENKNQQRCLNIIKDKFPHVSSGENSFLKEEVLSSNLPKRSQGDDCDWAYYKKLVELLEKYGLLNSLKLKDIRARVDGIDSLLEEDIKGVGDIFAIAVALNVKADVAHCMKRYRSLENFLTMSKPDLTVKEFARILTIHNRIAAVKEIYEKLSCDSTIEELRRLVFCKQTFAESRSGSWNMF